MKTSPEKSQPAGVDERLVAKLLKQAAPFAEREWPYAGVSWQQLKRYNEYEEPSSNFRMTAEDKYLTHLYAGLAVYCRDVNRYLRKHRRKDASHFRQVVAAVHAEERSFYRETAFPYDNPKFSYSAELQKFPTGIAEDAAAGQPHLKWLNTHQIRHEWTVKAG